MRAARMRGSRSRGVGLADFITGSVILAGAVGAWTALTKAQLDAAGDADRRSQARNAVVGVLERARAEGAGPLATLAGEADKDGFRLVKTFPLGNRSSLPGAQDGRLEARPLAVDGGSGRGLFELRAVGVWRGEHGNDRLELSTVVGGGAP